MFRNILILVGALYAGASFAESTCISQYQLGLLTLAQYNSCVGSTSQATTNTATSSTATSSISNLVDSCGRYQGDPSFGQATCTAAGIGSIFGSGNNNNIYTLLMLYQLGILPKQYVEYALFQKYPQLYWLTQIYGGDAVNTFLQAYQLQQFYAPYYAAASSGTGYSGYGTSNYAQQYAFYNFLQRAFLTPQATPTP